MRASVWVILLTSFASVRASSSAVHALESRYRNARTLKAAFFERYSDGNGAASAESGTVYFSRPGRMRWEYESPQEQLFIVDGTNVWFYIPADRTASRAKMKESADWRTPLALLAGKADLSKLCRSIELVGADSEQGSRLDERTVPAGDTVLRCLPREVSGEDAALQIVFETNPQAELVRVLIREAGRVETEFRFGNWEENIVIPEVKFHFQPPPGVSVVDEESLAGEIR